MKKMKKMVWMGIGIGVFFWFFEAVIHLIIFRHKDFYIELVNPDNHEVWMRLFVVCLFIVFGLYAQFVVDKRRAAEKATFFSNSELEQIFNTAADGMRVIDTNFNVLRINETFAAILGTAKEKLAGKKCYEMFHGPACHTPQCSLKRVLDGDKRIECYVEKERSDGQKVPCILTVTPLVDVNGKMIGIVEDFKDITEYKEAEKSLKRLNEELWKSNKKLKNMALRDPHTGLYNHRYLEEIIESEFNRAKRYFNSLSVIMLDIDYFKSINDVYGHEFGDLVLKQLARQIKRMVRQYDSVIRFGGEEFIIVSPQADRGAVLPLTQRILEAINVGNFGDNSHTVKLKVSIAVVSYPEDRVNKGMELVDFADQILHKVKESGGNRVFSSLDIKAGGSPADGESTKNNDVDYLRKKIEKLTTEAHQSVVEAVFAFVKTIELKDHYTGEHVERTVHYATNIARELNLSNEEIECIKKAAVLHDLGKIGMSEKILLKIERLTPEEFEEIKKHPQIGVDIIRPLQSLHDIIPLVLYHHERWDGTGYPIGLRGEEIPTGARIIAVADVYQALVSDRPYRKAYSKEEAIETIERMSGNQFDPQIVKIFLKILQEEK